MQNKEKFSLMRPFKEVHELNNKITNFLKKFLVQNT